DPARSLRSGRSQIEPSEARRYPAPARQVSQKSCWSSFEAPCLVKKSITNNLQTSYNFANLFTTKVAVRQRRKYLISALPNYHDFLVDYRFHLEARPPLLDRNARLVVRNQELQIPSAHILRQFELHLKWTNRN